MTDSLSTSQLKYYYFPRHLFFTILIPLAISYKYNLFSLQSDRVQWSRLDHAWTVLQTSQQKNCWNQSGLCKYIRLFSSNTKSNIAFPYHTGNSYRSRLRVKDVCLVTFTLFSIRVWKTSLTDSSVFFSFFHCSKGGGKYIKKCSINSPVGTKAVGK